MECSYSPERSPHCMVRVIIFVGSDFLAAGIAKGASDAFASEKGGSEL